MKKIAGLTLCLLLVLLCACALADVALDKAHFPDANFRKALKAFDTDRDGVLSDAEIGEIEDVDVSGKKIRSVKGVKYLTALQILICDNNLLQTIDVSRNAALTCLGLNDNQLTKLDVSKNPLLESLGINNNKLTRLDLSKNPRLDDLSCENNQLKELILGDKPALTYLKCQYNSDLTALDLSKCPELRYLQCVLCPIRDLDVSACEQLRLFLFNGSPQNTHTMTFGRHPFLTEIRCSLEYVRTLDLSGCPALETVSISSGRTLISVKMGSHPNLTQLDFANCKKLKSINVSQCPKILKLLKGEKHHDTFGGWIQWRSGSSHFTIGDQVTVITGREEKISALFLNKKKLSLTVGDSFQLTAKIKPEGAAGQPLGWSSGNKKVATVDKNGKIKAVGPGTCTITCKAKDGSGKKATCKITVTAPEKQE